ncbi:MAG: hypothetical protein QXU88_02705 [Candidatus Woesearchaeota archaeon]
MKVIKQEYFVDSKELMRILNSEDFKSHLEQVIKAAQENDSGRFKVIRKGLYIEHPKITVAYNDFSHHSGWEEIDFLANGSLTIHKSANFEFGIIDVGIGYPFPKRFYERRGNYFSNPLYLRISKENFQKMTKKEGPFFLQCKQISLKSLERIAKESYKEVDVLTRHLMFDHKNKSYLMDMPTLAEELEGLAVLVMKIEDVTK